MHINTGKNRYAHKHMFKFNNQETIIMTNSERRKLIQLG